MQETANFSVDPRLASLLGETYRSTEAALKELVDNAWDADADNVWITLPKHLTSEPIVVRDDGSGMTPDDVRREYLNIARDPRSRRGERSRKYKRRIKGRKGIGKFAGLAAARLMRIVTVAGSKRTSFDIDKEILLGTRDDLEKIPLPLTIEDAAPHEKGTVVTLSSLNQNLSFPREEAMRAALVHEYGRAQGFTVHVGGAPLAIEDVPGPTTAEQHTLPSAGNASLRFTIAEGKIPKYSGIVIKAGGKVIGRPMLFGLDEDPEIPPNVAKRVYGEVEVDGLEDDVTADWGAVFENSKAFQEVRQLVHDRAREALYATYKREIDLQKARLQREIKRRLERLPEHRRSFAEAAILRVLQKFYGLMGEERITAIANLMLDGMERDEYWAVLQKINEARHADVATFADALDAFGLLELSLIAERARHRMNYLDSLDALAANPETLEKDIHKAIEKSLWVLGNRYALMASNETLKRIVITYCDKTYTGNRASRRPDLLLAADPGESYLLIEFKRPTHPIDRQDEAQAQQYRDDLAPYLPAKPIDVIVLGGSRDATMDTRYETTRLRIHSYNDIISQARYDLEWIIKTLPN